VGQLYLTGLDTMGQDLSEARTWLAAAASRGDRESQRLLGELDRAQAAERDHARRLQLLSAQTAAYWASAAYAAYWWHPNRHYGHYGWY
jgi:TPR repeat protein